MDFGNKFNLKDVIYITAILVIVLSFSLYSVIVARNNTLNRSPGESVLSLNKAKSRVNSFLGKQLAGRATFSLGDITSTSGIYKLDLKINSKSVPSLYLSKDGRWLFVQAIDLNKFLDESKKITCQNVTKAKQPKLTAFVVSYCPFGLQTERILSDIVKNIPELKNNIRIEYLGSINDGKITSMHGDKEAQENLRQICLREEQPADYWNYISCHIKKGEVNPCLISAKVDTKKLENCLSDKNRGLAYAKKDFSDDQKYNINASPNYVFNGKLLDERNLDFGGRSSEAFKDLICCSFSSRPQFCSKKLHTERAAPSFSETYSEKGSTNKGGSCK